MRILSGLTHVRLRPLKPPGLYKGGRDGGAIFESLETSCIFVTGWRLNHLVVNFPCIPIVLYAEGFKLDPFFERIPLDGKSKYLLINRIIHAFLPELRR